MKEFGKDNFLEDENKILNDYFLSSDLGLGSLNPNPSTNTTTNKNLNLNINDLENDEELKNFAQSLSIGQEDQNKKSEPSSLFSNLGIEAEKSNNPEISLFKNYLTRLKNFGFPELGDISLSKDPQEQEKTFKFFDYIIMKRISNLEDYQKYKKSNEVLDKKCEDYELQINKYQKEISNLRNELKSYTKEKTDYEFKCNKQKEHYEKLMNKIKKENIFLNNKINKILLEKRALEEKIQSLIEIVNKQEINKSKIMNSVEIIDYVQKNNISKMLEKVKGAEKLVETLKGGYNDSLRELLFEISALKNFIYDCHTEITLLLDEPETLDKELLNMSFLDTVSGIKDIFNSNMGKIKEKLGFLNNEQMDYANLNQFIDEENINNK